MSPYSSRKIQQSKLQVEMGQTASETPGLGSSNSSWKALSPAGAIHVAGTAASEA